MNVEVQEFIDSLVGTKVVPVPDKYVSVIIPFYGNWHLTHRRMMELYSHIPFPIEIVLVNDFSQDEDIDGAVEWWSGNTKHSVIYVKNDENLGFGKSMNIGVEASSGAVIVLLSNDVTIRGDFISQILEKLEDNEDVLIGGELHDWNTGWNILPINGKQMVFPYAAGWLLACTREVWNDLGGFDPIYAPYDYEDVCLSTTAIHSGYRLVGLNSPYLSHLSGQTVRKANPNREQITLRNRQRFIDKWSKILK